MKRPGHLTQEPDRDDPDVDPPMIFFYNRGCPECETVKEVWLEPFLEHLGLTLESVRWVDVTQEGGLREFLAVERRIGSKASVLAPVLVLGPEAYCGIESIRKAVLEGSEPP